MAKAANSNIKAHTIRLLLCDLPSKAADLRTADPGNFGGKGGCRDKQANNPDDRTTRHARFEPRGPDDSAGVTEEMLNDAHLIARPVS